MRMTGTRQVQVTSWDRIREAERDLNELKRSALRMAGWRESSRSGELLFIKDIGGVLVGLPLDDAVRVEATAANERA